MGKKVVILTLMLNFLGDRLAKWSRRGVCSMHGHHFDLQSQVILSARYKLTSVKK